MPTGGVIRLISITQTIRMPNQTGSKPRPWTSGKKIGTVSSIIESDSIAHAEHDVDQADHDDHHDRRDLELL